MQQENVVLKMQLNSSDSGKHIHRILPTSVSENLKM